MKKQPKKNNTYPNNILNTKVNLKLSFHNTQRLVSRITDLNFVIN